MDILSELASAAKWSKINSYISLLSFIVSILFILVGAVAPIFILLSMGSAVMVVSSWIVRKVFIRYEQSARQAIESLSGTAIEEVCHYQRNVFAMFGIGHIFVFVVLVQFVLN